MRTVLSFLVSAVSLLVACADGGSPECYEVCERANACSLAERAVDVECDHYCPAVENMQARMQKAANDGLWDPAGGSVTCAELFNEHISCWRANLGQVCNTADFTDCAASGEAWTACMEPYCEAQRVAGNVNTVAEPNCFIDALPGPDGIAGTADDVPIGVPALAPF